MPVRYTGKRAGSRNYVEDHKVYLFFDKISPQLRSFVSFLLIVTGFLFQLSSKNILTGLPFIIGCLILNLMKGVSVKKIRPSNVTWQQVTPGKIDEVSVQCKKIKKFRSRGAGAVVAVFIFVVIGLSFGMQLLEAVSSIPLPLGAAMINAIILFSGLALTGRKSAWMPYALDIKIETVKRLINSAVIKEDPALQVVPYLEIGETKGGTVPMDTRLLVKFKNAPPAFIGLQGQVSINTVKSRKYPYFYVVLLAKPEFHLFEKFKDPLLDKLVIEHKETEEVDVIVVRQRTTKTSGFHTNEQIQDYILLNGIQLAKDII